MARRKRADSIGDLFEGMDAEGAGQQLSFEFPVSTPRDFEPPTKRDMVYLRMELAKYSMMVGKVREASDCLTEVSRLQGLYAPEKVEVTRNPLDQIMDEVAARTPQGGLSDLVTH